ncbi:MAG: hypothetical protein JW782_07095 [Candidatus Saganbacteria bacterium]|nr:hypothetical protein [Candidatus Saganbacteria bacterium]
MVILIKLLQFILRLVFFLPAGWALNVMYGLAWLTRLALSPFAPRKQIAANFRLVLPDVPAEELTEKLLTNTVYAVFEVLCQPFLKAQHFKRLISWQGLEQIKPALDKGRGAILLTMHAGNYELPQAALASLGYPMTAILRTTNEPIFEIINSSRAAQGTQLINILEADMYKSSLKALNENRLVYLLADTGALESRHETISFLGKTVPAATGWLTLAQRSGCSVIPVLAKKDGRSNIVTVFPAREVTKDNRDEAKNDILAAFESVIRQQPEQWGIFLNAYEVERMTVPRPLDDARGNQARGDGGKNDE